MKTSFRRKVQYLHIGLASLIIMVLLSSCQQQFDKQKWNKRDASGIYPYRNAMLNDLAGNRLKGMSQRQLIEYLGKPDEQQQIDVTEIRYNIVKKFDSDGKPMHTRNLLVKLKNNLVAEVGIEETKID